MRILHVIQEPRGGGAERVVEALSRAAAEDGHLVAVASSPQLPLVQRKPWRIPVAARALGHRLRSEPPDVVHGHNPGMAVTTALATLRGRRVPALVTVHGVPEEDYRRAAAILRLSGLPVVACGPGVAAALLEHGLSPLATIVNGIPAAPAEARSFPPADLRLERSRPLLVTIGRLVPQKNHRLAISALVRVPEATLVIVGDGPLRAELARQAEQCGLSDRVVLAGRREDARELIGAADAVVLPSLWEGLPLVALEALAAGTPLVATSVRGIRELVDQRCAVLVPPEDPMALAEGLRSVLSDAELRVRLADAGRALARRYSEEAMASAYLDLYLRLVSRAP